MFSEGAGAVLEKHWYCHTVGMHFLQNPSFCKPIEAISGRILHASDHDVLPTGGGGRIVAVIGIGLTASVRILHAIGLL